MVQTKSENMFDKVYKIVEKIPYGRVTTYGQIARMLGNPRLSRAVGYALHVSAANLPCHRVVDRFGHLAKAFEHDGINEQQLLLEEEGVRFIDDETVDLEGFMWYGEEL